ncbi:Card1-like endonuclease domain-containing protein [Sediminibacterium sp. C3]|uniref:Card1-like endonuclease domain-containing protein n=1 Tax=Sediminibacterium sp. C3 TaxID=1267211 RepID=UPI00041B0FFD|nr:DUF1887 family CARF protein [Sediminibacterium sp. C3]
MKHQITFVGGQLLPVLVGIKEFAPDKIHFIVSEESKSKISLIKSFLTGNTFSENICNPFEFASIKSICEEILNNIDQNDDVQFNLTGGTKIMVLAAQSLIIERNLDGFYINQNDTLLQLPSYSTRKLTSQITVKEFLEISGHKLSRSKTISDFSSDDFKSIDIIDKFTMSHDRLILEINSKVRKTYDKLNKIPTAGHLAINQQAKLIWTDKRISVELNGNEVFKIQSPNVRSLFFHASWWELIVAKEISLWPKAKELLIQCELPFRTDSFITKNEIDVLVNLGGKLIFIECKSGNVNQEDINKMRIVKDTYGGIISKSLLVCRFRPKPTILEKCKELNIDVFFCNAGRTTVNPLSKLINALDKLEKKLTI